MGRVERDVKPLRVAGYELGETLAQGAGGTVFMARDRHGRSVVWKRHEAGAGETSGLAEAQLLGLRHAGLAACLDAGRIAGDGRLYTVTEHVLGAAFGPDALDPTPVPAERALALCVRLLSALATVHERGLLHRDLKDDNVRLEAATDRPVILDFGLACLAAESARLPAAGTPRAMAPELFAGAPASVASDLWAAGLLLAEALLGRRLSRATEPEALLAERSAWSGFSDDDSRRIGEPALVALLGRLLDPHPERRPQDCRAALAALPQLPAALAAELAREHLDGRLSGALVAQDESRHARLAALARRESWVAAFPTPDSTLIDAVQTVIALMRDAAGSSPGLDARLARAAALDAPGVTDLCGLIEALASLAPLTLEMGLCRATAESLQARREVAKKLEVVPAVHVFDEPALTSDGAIDALRAAFGMHAVLEHRMRAAPPPTREALAQALGALLRSGVVGTWAGTLVVTETRLPPGWPAQAVSALPADLSQHARTVLALLCLSPRALSARDCQAVVGSSVEAALRELQLPGLIVRHRSDPADLHAPVDGRSARGWRALLPVPSGMRSRLALVMAESGRRDRHPEATAATHAAHAAHAAAATHATERKGLHDAEPARASDADAGGLFDEEAAAAVAEVLGSEAPATHDADELTQVILESAETLRRVGRVSLAAELLRRGLSGCDLGSRRLRALWLGLLDALIRLQFFDQALAALAEARAQLADDPALDVREARTHFLRGQVPESLALLDRLEVGAMPRDDALLALLLRSQARQTAGRLPEALTDVREGLRRAGEPGDRHTMALLERAAVIEARLGHFDEAVRLYESCIALARKLGRGLLVGSPMFNLGRALVARGERRRGLAVQEDGARQLALAGDQANLAMALNSLGAEWISLGRLDTARRHLARSLEIARSLPALGVAAMALNNTGRALAAEGRHDEAEAAFAESLRIRVARGDRVGQAAVAIMRGFVRCQRGQLDEAGADLAAARGNLSGLDGTDWAVEADLLDARLALAEERFPDAAAAAGRAREHCLRRGKTSEGLAALDLLARAGAADLESVDPAALDRGPWLADLLFTRAGLRSAAGRHLEADADMAVALTMLGEAPDGPIEARGLVHRAEGDLAQLAEELCRPVPDYGKVGTWLARASRDHERAAVLVELLDLAPLRDRLARCGARLAAAGEGEEMSGLSVLSERLRNLERLAEINKALNTERDTQRLLELIVDSAIELTGAARGFLILFDGRSEEFRAARNIDESTIHNPEFEVSHSVARRVAKEGRAVITANAIDDPRFGSAASISELKLLSILCVPLVSRDRTLGAVYLDHPQVVGRFDEHHLGTVTALAEQAAIALENARLSEGLARTNRDLRESREEITRLNEALQSRLVQREAELEAVRESLDASRRALELRYDYSNIITCNPGMHAVMDLLDRITDTDFPVLIQGESGTGKELIARAIHFNGARRTMNFVSLNCAAISEQLIESELFGHVRGAFTGADRDHKGLFEQAHGGTLFLDEIGDMSDGVQKRLLRVLQSGEFLAVGGRDVRKVDVRVLCATHRDLKVLVAEREFREDLYFRLAVVKVQLPPLRERSEDIPLLLGHLLQRHGGGTRTIEPEAQALLAAQPWPGNVRELENFSRNLLLFDREGTRVGAALVRRLLSGGGVDPIPAAVAAPGDASLPIRSRLEAFERSLVEEALAKSGGNKAQAARELGVGIRTLYKMLERLGFQAAAPGRSGETPPGGS